MFLSFRNIQTSRGPKFVISHFLEVDQNPVGSAKRANSLVPLPGHGIRLQRIYNFLCSMLVFTPFA
jgi:hypothetical protein